MKIKINILGIAIGLLTLFLNFSIIGSNSSDEKNVFTTTLQNANANIADWKSGWARKNFSELNFIPSPTATNGWGGYHYYVNIKCCSPAVDMSSCDFDKNAASCGSHVDYSNVN